jgi:hypothetical protein
VDDPNRSVGSARLTQAEWCDRLLRSLPGAAGDGCNAQVDVEPAPPARAMRPVREETV